MNIRWRIAQAAERRWWKNYLGNKPVEDYLKWKRGYWIDFLKKNSIEIPRGQMILDAGCGPAGIFTILESNQVDALDPLVNIYTSDLPHFNPADYPHVHFINTPLEELTVQAKYDTVFCLNAINHVSNLSLSIDKLGEAVKPGGQLVLSVDVHNFTFLKSIFRMIPGDILHPHQHDLKDYCRFVERAGFEIERKMQLKREFIFSYWVIIAKKAGK